MKNKQQKINCFLALLAITSLSLASPLLSAEIAQASESKNLQNQTVNERQVDQTVAVKKKPFDGIDTLLILCPPVATGGPTALHQLFTEAQSLVTTYLLYVPSNGSLFDWFSKQGNVLTYKQEFDPTPDAYRKYKPRFPKHPITLNEKIGIIIPEVWTDAASFFDPAQIGIWWLSLENFYLSQGNNRFKQLIDEKKLDKEPIVHFYQAPFIEKALSPNSCSMYPLYDYLEDHFLERAGNISKQVVPKRIAYFPRKGAQLAATLIPQLPEYEWFRLENLTPEGVAEELSKSWAYIDFGDQPGKDRVPREAAMCGCLVLLHYMGAARDFDSAPLPLDHKFSSGAITDGSLAEKVKFIMENKNDKTEWDKQEFYRNSILAEKSEFKKQVQNYFFSSTNQKASQLFDSAFYSKAYRVPENEAFSHYLTEGFQEDHRPNTWFDEKFYLKGEENENKNIPPLLRYSKNAQINLAKAQKFKWDVIISGAGYAGSVSARRLAEAGLSVALFDKKDFLGGHANDYHDENNALVHRYGPHIFHTHKKQVFEFLSQFTDWRFYEHRVKSLLDGKLYPMPINRTTINTLYNLDLKTDEECENYYKSVKEPIKEIKNSEDVVLSQVGRDLCDKFFAGYTKKQWGGLELKDLSPEVLKRIPTRTNDEDRYFTDKYQMMPLKGYTEMFKKMVDHPNISTFLGIDFLELKETFDYKHLIFTGPIDAYFGYKYENLPYRSVEFKFEHHPDKKFYQEVGTVNYPNDGDFTRITEFKHLTGQEGQGTTIVKEYPKDEKETKEPFYPVLRPDNEERYRLYRDLADKEENVTFIGRLAEYKYYNMDQVTEVALKTADALLLNEKFQKKLH